MNEIVGEPIDRHGSLDPLVAMHEEQPVAQRDEPPAAGVAAAGETVTSQWSSQMVDYVVAGCLCVAALGYWTSDSLTTSSAPTSANVSAAPVQPPQTWVESAQLGNEGAKLYYAGKYAEAEMLLRKAIDLNPNSAPAYCNLGVDLIAEGHYDEAIAVLGRSLQLDPNLTLAQNNLKWANEEKGKHAK